MRCEVRIGGLAETLPLDGIDTLVFCASKGFRHVPPLIAQLNKSHLMRAVLISTTAIFTSLPSASRAVESEAAVQARDLDRTILRPTMIYATIRDRNISRLLHYLQKWPLFPVCGNALWQLIRLADLADAVISCIDTPATIGHIYNVTVPSRCASRS